METWDSSLPSRERGLKLCVLCDLQSLSRVAPFAGAWIEIIFCIFILLNVIDVAPFAGAWIEIPCRLVTWRQEVVAPFAGAWIEI